MTDTQNTLNVLYDLTRQYTDIQNARTNISRQLKAIDRRGERNNAPAKQVTAWKLPLQEVHDTLKTKERQIKTSVVKEFRKLPIAPWVKEYAKGAGEFNTSLILAEAGNLYNYPTVAKLWKRMGLAVIDGRAQRKCANKELAEKHGFSPYRRRIMYNTGQSLMKAGAGNYYYDLYIEKKAYRAALNEALPEKSKDYRNAHNWALRYIEKRYLRELWKAWQKIIPD